MKQSFKSYLPAFIVVMASLILVASSYLRIPMLHLGSVQGATLKGNIMVIKIVNLSGAAAVALGAASFSWFIFKKKMKSSPKLIKDTGKKIYNLHAYFGWAALILVIVHGSYYIVTNAANSRVLTGIAAFLILVCIAAYGFVLKRTKNKSIKKVHFMLTAVWLITLLIHGGGVVILGSGGLLGLYILLSLLKSEQVETSPKAKTKKKATAL